MHLRYNPAMSTPEEKRDKPVVRVNLKLKPAVHKQIRKLVADQDTNMQDWIEKVIETQLALPENRKYAKTD
jgi:predicted HicB family RNase H-like nuclease